MTQRIIFLLAIFALFSGVRAQGLYDYEYWMDSNHAERMVMTGRSEITELSIPIRDMSPGIHFLNFRARNTKDGWGNLYREIFFLPIELGDDTHFSYYEYWIDKDYSHKVVHYGNKENEMSPTASIDISNLAPGIHFFNYRAKSSNIDQGLFLRYLFFIPANDGEDSAMTGYEYWLDDDYDNCIKQLDGSGECQLHIDVSELPSGIHFLNFRTITEGIYGNLNRSLFFIPEAFVNPQDIAEYEYWLDNNTEDKIVGNDNNSDLLINIPLEGFEPGEHTFFFRAKNTQGVWGSVYVGTFILDVLSGMDTLLSDDAFHDVYNLNGIKLRSKAKAEELRHLPSGIYIIDGHKVLK